MVLPDDMIDEVLCRLAVKPLLRFRCVSKRWCSLIDSNAFMKKQLRIRIKCNTARALVLRPTTHRNFCYFVGLDSLDDVDSAPLVEIKGPVKYLLSSPHYVGVANGLVSVIRFMDHTPVVFLVNPSTRKFMKISSPPVEFPDNLSNQAFGFGYDHVSDDFKVVRSAKCETGFFVTVYSHKTNAWTVVNRDDIDIIFSHSHGYFASGSLYWLTKRISDSAQFMFRVDLDTQQSVLEPFTASCMPALDMRSYPRTPIVVFKSVDGNLCVVHTHKDSRLDLWLMNNSERKWTWSKALSFMQSEALGESWYCTPVGFPWSGEDVLLEATNKFLGTKLVCYDLKTKTVKDVEILGIPSHFKSFVYTESLLHLPDHLLPEGIIGKPNIWNSFFERAS